MAERPEGGRPQNAASNNALGALLTMFAMLCFAGMDAISKWLVADYAVLQILFIRSMATRGHLGGLSRATGDAALVLGVRSRKTSH